MQVSLQDNIAQSNGVYGVQFFDTNGGDNIVADMGGGTLGSTGGNSLGNNTSEEIRLDFDGVGNLKAENNWWGAASGLAGAELEDSDGSSIDASPFLTSDPNQ